MVWVFAPALSVISEAPHPFGPAGGLNAAAFGPRAARIEVLVPVQRPKFLEADRADGPVEEQVIGVAVVPVDADHATSLFGFLARLLQLL